MGGDADVNKTVDFADLGIQRNNFNTAGSWTSGDFDDNLLVDFADLGIFLNNYD